MGNTSKSNRTIPWTIQFEGRMGPIELMGCTCLSLLG